MSKKEKIVVAVAVVAAFALGAGSMCGCAYFTQERVAAIHQTVATSLQNAYNNGGAEKVNAKIDDLVKEGKLSTLQAEKLKEALQKGYDSLQTKLNELAVKDVEVEPEQTAK